MFNLSLKIIQNIRRSFFPFYRNKELQYIFKKLQEGFPSETVVARFVGGCVRRHISGEKVDDIDIATILTTDQIKEKFENTNLKVINTGVTHGTVTIISENQKVELTTLRKDLKTDGRHAEVEYTDDWKLDSERRDFTINAIYLDIKGKIYDPQMGLDDLKNKNVKFIGDPQKRIEEDYLRIIRFIRFKITYDIKVEEAISSIIKQNLDGIKKISKERILLELFKLLDLKNFFKINDNIHLREIFILIFPEFMYLNRLGRLKKINNYREFDREILLGLLLIDQKKNHEYFVHKYNVSNRIKDILENLALNLEELKKNKQFLDQDLIKNIYIHGKDHLKALNLINFSINPKTKLYEFKKILNRISKSNIPKFPIDGEFLKQNGLREGKTLGKILKKIEKEWIDNSFKISNERIKELIRVNSI